MKTVKELKEVKWRLIADLYHTRDSRLKNAKKKQIKQINLIIGRGNNVKQRQNGCHKKKDSQMRRAEIGLTA